MDCNYLSSDSEYSSSSDSGFEMVENNEELLNLIRKNASTNEIEKAMLNRGVTLNYQNIIGDTALHVAIKDAADTKVIDLLIEKGANLLEIKNKKGKTPLDLLKERLAKNPNDSNLKLVKLKRQHSNDTVEFYLKRQKLDDLRSKLNKYRDPHSQESKEFEKYAKNLCDSEEPLKEKRQQISEVTDLNWIKAEIQKSPLEEIIRKKTKDEILIKKIDSDLDEIKDRLKKVLDQIISQIPYAKCAMNIVKLRPKDDEWDDLEQSSNKNAFLDDKSHSLKIVYPEDLRSQRIFFENEPIKCFFKQLEHFLQTSSDQICYIYTKSTVLSEFKLLQILQSFPTLFKKRSSYIFLSLKTLLIGEWRKQISKAFEKHKNRNLFVLEFEESSSIEEFELESICKKLDGSKKVIFLIQSSKPNLNSSSYQKIIDYTSFEDLKDDSQAKLLSKEINVQGNNISELINKNFSNEFFNEAILTKFIGSNEIRFGNEDAFSSIQYIKDLYIDKKFIRQKIKPEILKTSNHLIFITGASTNEKHLIKLGAQRNNIFRWEPKSIFEKGIIISSSSDKNDEEIFQNLGGNVYWLELNDLNHLFWKDFKGKIEETFIKHIDKNYVTSDEVEIFKEKGFCDSENFAQKVVIIAGDPGMGKSTLLTSMARRIKGLDDPEKSRINNSWIVRINLNEYTNEKWSLNLNRINFEEHETEVAIDFVTKMAIPHEVTDTNDTITQRKLFKLSLLNYNYIDDKFKLKKPKIIIMFDGFDEISPIYRQHITSLIKVLKYSEVAQIWITTRPHEKDYLEQELGTPAYILNQLSRSDRIDFLSRFWKWHLAFSFDSSSGEIYTKTHEEIRTYLKEIKLPDADYAKQLKKNISYILQKYSIRNVNKFNELRKAINRMNFAPYAEELLNESLLGKNPKSPLHLKMLSEIMFDRKFQFQVDTLTSIYDRFVQEKSNFTESNKHFNEVRSKIAVEHLFPNEAFCSNSKAFDISDHEKQELIRYGLLVWNKGKLQFIHRSFCEYFCSEYLINNLKDEEVQKFLIKKNFLLDDDVLISQFLNKKIENEKIKLKEAAVQLVRVNLGEEQMLLHRVAKDGYHGICKFLLNSVRHINDLHVDLLTKTDFQNQNVLRVAVSNTSLYNYDISIISTISEHIAKYPKIQKELLLETNDRGETILLKLVVNCLNNCISFKKFHGMFDALVGNIHDQEYFKDLMTISVFGNLDENVPMENVEKLQKLLNAKFDIKLFETLDLIKLNLLKAEGEKQNLISTVCNGEKQKCFDILNESQPFEKELLLLAYEKDRSIFQKAIEMNQYEILQKLLAIVKNISRKLQKLLLGLNKNGGSMLHLVAQSDDHRTVSVILENFNDLETKELLKEMLLKRDENEKTPIELAIDAHQYQNVVKILMHIQEYFRGVLEFRNLLKSVNISSTLEWAKENESDSYQRLLEILPDEKIIFDLFKAVGENAAGKVKVFLEKIFHCDIEMVKKILLAKNMDGKTILDVSIFNKNYTIYNWASSYFNEDRKSFSFLSNRTYDSDLEYEIWINDVTFSNLIRNDCKVAEIEDILSKKIVNINYKNINDDTPLHLAVKYVLNRNQTDIIETLIYRGAKATIKNNMNRTPLDLINECIEMHKEDKKHLPYLNAIKELLENPQEKLSKQTKPSRNLRKRQYYSNEICIEQCGTPSKRR